MVFKDRQEVMAIIASIFIAFVLWMYVMGDKNPVQTKVIQGVDVTLTNIENIEQANLSLLPNQKFTVDLTITGRALDVFNAKPEDFRVEADMGGYLKKGDNNIPIEVKASPKGVQVVNKNTYIYIKVKLDLLVEKSVPININVTGSARTGYGYVQPVIRPSEALISGPATYVNSVASAFGTVDINNSQTDVSSSIPIKAIDREGRVVSYANVEPRYIDVFIPIRPSKTVPVAVKTTGNLPPDRILKYTKSKVESLVLLGDKKILDKINEIATVEYDISNLQTSTTKEVPLKIPEGISVFGGTKSINVDFVVENKIEKIIDVPVTFLNKNDSLNYSFEKDYISVNLVGAESIMDELDVKVVLATADLKELGEGSHSVPVKVEVPGNIEVKDYTPQKISVTVQKK